MDPVILEECIKKFLAVSKEYFLGTKEEESNPTDDIIDESDDSTIICGSEIPN